MSRRWEEVVDEFDAETEGGEKVRILVWQTMIDAGHQEDRSAAPVRGLKTFRTADGHHCNQIDDGTFEIVELGCRVRKL